MLESIRTPRRLIYVTPRPYQMTIRINEDDEDNGITGVLRLTATTITNSLLANQANVTEGNLQQNPVPSSQQAGPAAAPDSKDLIDLTAVDLVRIMNNPEENKKLYDKLMKGQNEAYAESSNPATTSSQATSSLSVTDRGELLAQQLSIPGTSNIATEGKFDEDLGSDTISIDLSDIDFTDSSNMYSMDSMHCDEEPMDCDEEPMDCDEEPMGEQGATAEDEVSTVEIETTKNTTVEIERRQNQVWLRNDKTPYDRSSKEPKGGVVKEFKKSGVKGKSGVKRKSGVDKEDKIKAVECKTKLKR